MTTVGGSTEIIKRHHLLAPIEHGCLGDLEDLVAMARSAIGSHADDAAKLVMDDENVHITWEEVVDANYDSELDDFQMWIASKGGNLDGAVIIVNAIKAYQAHKASRR